MSVEGRVYTTQYAQSPIWNMTGVQEKTDLPDALQQMPCLETHPLAYIYIYVHMYIFMYIYIYICTWQVLNMVDLRWVDVEGTPKGHHLCLGSLVLRNTYMHVDVQKFRRCFILWRSLHICGTLKNKQMSNDIGGNLRLLMVF